MEYIPYIIDGLIIAIPVISLIIGHKRGFAAIVLPLAVTIGAMVLCRLYAQDIADKLTELYIHGSLTKSIATEISSGIVSGEATLSEALPQWLMAMAEKAGYSPAAASASIPVAEISESTAKYAENLIFTPLLICIIYITMYAGAKFAGRLLVKPADLIAKLPILRQSNNLLGAIFGFLSGLIRVAIVLIIVITVIMLADNKDINAVVDQTYILHFLTDKAELIF